MASTKADFSQNDPRWANNLLGFSKWEKMGPYGCLITAGANVLQAQGLDIDPAQLNTLLKSRQQFVYDSYRELADVAGYWVFGTVWAHTKFVEQKNWPGNVVAPASYFDVRSSTNTEIIAMIDYHPEKAGVQNHYVRIIGLNPAKTDVEIVDSWDGKRKWLSSISRGTNPLGMIWTAGKYQKV